MSNLMLPLQTWGQDLGVEYVSISTISIFVLFSLLMVGIGILAAKFQKNREEYFVAGRRVGIVVVALAAYATLLSGWGTVGTAGLIYLLGPEFAVLNSTIIIGLLIAYWLLARKMRALGDVKNAITVPDAMYYRFGESDNMRLLGVVSVILGCMGYLAAQYAAIGIILAIILPVGFLTGLLIGLAVVGFYTVIGGMLAALWSDAVQGLIMAFTAVLATAFMVINFPGGTSGMISTMQEADPAYWNFTTLGMEGHMTWGLIISIMIIFATAAGQPQVVSKFYMVRDVKLLKWGAVISGIAFIPAMLWWFMGMFARSGVEAGVAQEPTNPDAALVIALIEFTPDIVIGLALTGVVAAIMSTSNAFLNLASAAVTHDYYLEYRNEDLSDKREVQIGRLTTVAIIVLAGLLAWGFPGLIFTLGAAGWALFAVVVIPCVALAYNWKGATLEGAFAGGAIGLLATIGFAYGTEFFDITVPYGLLGGQVATVLAVVIFVVVSLVTDTASYDDLDDEMQFVLDMGRTRGIPEEGIQSPTAADGGEPVDTINDD